MWILNKNFVEVVWVSTGLIILVIGSLIAIAIARRRYNDRHYRRLDHLRAQYRPVLAALLDERFDYQRGLRALGQIKGPDRIDMLERLLLVGTHTSDQVPIVRQLCEDLGLVEAWHRALTGQNDSASRRDSLPRPKGGVKVTNPINQILRAKSAENLGRIRHQPSWRLLVHALDDRYLDVRSAAVRALAAIGEPESFAVLVTVFEGMIQANRATLSFRDVKAALVRFPLSQAVGLKESLQHPHPRVRFVATDIIREMVERLAAVEQDLVLGSEVFDPDLSELFLTKLTDDENSDVRARATRVISFLEDARATPTLLMLLDDPVWFVRMHTVRALSRRKYAPQAKTIARLLSDPNWRVREATARTLLALGREGSVQLVEHLRNTRDHYSVEQIAEEMRRFKVTTTFSQSREVDALRSEAITRLEEMDKTN